MRDNIEHVITCWVLGNRFRSPGRVGFEVISHWLPSLLSERFGGLGVLAGSAGPTEQTRSRIYDLFAGRTS